MPAPANNTPVVAQMVISLHANGKISFQAQIPSREAGIMMLEVAKLDFNEHVKRQEAEAAQKVIETPPHGFDPSKIPTSNGLRTAG